MAITRRTNSLSTGIGNNASSVVISGASAALTTGDRMVVVGVKFTPTQDDFVVGDVALTSGDGTLGSWALDGAASFNETGTEYIAVGIWSAPVTDGGVAAPQFTVTGGSGCYWWGCAFALVGTSISKETSNTGSGGVETTVLTGGDVTTAGAACLVSGVCVYNPTAASFAPATDWVEYAANEAGTGQGGCCNVRDVTTGNTYGAAWTTTVDESSIYSFAGTTVAYKEAGAPTASVADTTTLSENVAVTGAYAPALFSDTVTATDTASGSTADVGGTPLTQSASDQVTATDAITDLRGAFAPVAFAETVTLAENVAVLGAYTPALFADQVTASDVVVNAGTTGPATGPPLAVFLVEQQL